MALEDVAVVGVGGPRALGPTALHESDVERPGGVAVGGDAREEDDGEHADQGAGAGAAGARRAGRPGPRRR